MADNYHYKGWGVSNADAEAHRSDLNELLVYRDGEIVERFRTSSHDPSIRKALECEASNAINRLRDKFPQATYRMVWDDSQ